MLWRSLIIENKAFITSSYTMLMLVLTGLEAYKSESFTTMMVKLIMTPSHTRNQVTLKRKSDDSAMRPTPWAVVEDAKPLISPLTLSSLDPFCQFSFDFFGKPWLSFNIKQRSVVNASFVFQFSSYFGKGFDAMQTSSLSRLAGIDVSRGSRFFFRDDYKACCTLLSEEQLGRRFSVIKSIVIWKYTLQWKFKQTMAILIYFVSNPPPIQSFGRHNGLGTCQKRQLRHWLVGQWFDASLDIDLP